MSQVLGANAPKTSLSEHLVEHPVAEVVAVERPAVLVAEGPFGYVPPAPLEGLSLASRQEGLERLRELCRRVHSAGLAVLGRRDSARHEILADFDEPPVQVDIAPLER